MALSNRLPKIAHRSTWETDSAKGTCASMVTGMRFARASEILLPRIASAMRLPVLMGAVSPARSPSNSARY